MRPSEIKRMHDLADRLHERIDWLEHERKVAARYAAAGSRSGPSSAGVVSGSTTPDLTVAGRALHSDAYEQACASELNSIMRDLYRILDRDPAKKADARQSA